MSLTAAVINARIGDLSLGLQMAGFHIAVAFESDDRAAAIHQTNLHNEIIPLSLEQIEPGMLPNVDLLAARIKLSSRNSTVQDQAASNLLHLLEYHKPRCLFLIFDSASPNRDRFNCFLDQLAKVGYRFQYRKVDVSQAIGIPVKESILYVVATAEYASDAIPDTFSHSRNRPPFMLSCVMTILLTRGIIKSSSTAHQSKDMADLCSVGEMTATLMLISYNGIHLTFP